MESWGELFATGEAWYRGVPFEVVQLIYPDRNGFLPYEPGYEHRMRLAQPVIGDGLRPRRIASRVPPLLRSRSAFRVAWTSRPGNLGERPKVPPPPPRGVGCGRIRPATKRSGRSRCLDPTTRPKDQHDEPRHAIAASDA